MKTIHWNLKFAIQSCELSSDLAEERRGLKVLQVLVQVIQIIFQICHLQIVLYPFEAVLTLHAGNHHSLNEL